MIPSFEFFRWAGVTLIVAGIVLSAGEITQDLDESWLAPFMAVSAVLLLAGIGFVVPDLLLSLSYVLGLGGWIFYVVGIMAPVYFASRLLVI